MSIRTRWRASISTKKIESGTYLSPKMSVDVAQIFIDRLLSMTEVEREEILAQRQDEMQKIKDRKALDALIAAQQGDVSSAAKRASQCRHYDH